MGQDKTKADDSQKKNADTSDELAAERLAAETWPDRKPAASKAEAPASKAEAPSGSDAAPKAADSARPEPTDNASRIENGKPFSAVADAAIRDNLGKWLSSNATDGSTDQGGLRRFAGFVDQINQMIKNNNADGSNKTTDIDKDRLNRVLNVVEKYQSNQDALADALKKNDQPTLDRLLKEQAELKKQMETKEFKQDLQSATQDISKGYNVLRQGLGTTYDGMLSTLVELGRKVPLEQMPQELPAGINGFTISNEQFRSLVSQGQFKLPERTVAPNELPSSNDFREVNKLLRFSDAAQQEINRGMLEQQFSLAKDKLTRIDGSGELAKKWFPEKVETLSNDQIEKRLAAATPWIQKGLEVQRYAELHDRLNKMIGEQFNWPSFMGGIPSKWDKSAISSNPNVVAVDRDAASRKVNISVKMPDSLERNDANMDQMRQMDEWLAKYKAPVDQVLSQIDASKAENSVIYWGDIKADTRVDRDGNLVEKGWRDAQGRQVFQESDGRKYRFNDTNAKEFVPTTEKLSEGEYRVINGKIDWIKPGEEIKDVNLMEFRTDAKQVKGPNGEPLIEIKQVQNLQYAHWASYNGWGWVSNEKTMGGDIKAQKLDKDLSIPEDKGAAGGRRDGKSGDYLVTLADGRQQVIDTKSFEQLYRAKDGKPGEFEEKPKTYKPDDWLVVYRTDGGSPQPTLMQAKDVPSFVTSQSRWHYGTKVVTTGVDVLMLASGVAEVRGAMLGVEAAAGTAAKMTTMQVLGKALMTQQGAFGALHAGMGATGFMGQGIENLGPYGKNFMQIRALAMIADLGYTAIGRPGSAAGFVASSEQISQQGAFLRGLMKFNQALGNETRLGKIQAMAADGFFLTDIGVRQIPGLINRFRGTDSQQVQQQQALAKRWTQAELPEDRKSPSSFDKQTMMRIDAFSKSTEDALNLPSDDAKRVALNKQLIETVQNEKSDPRDRLGAAFALVNLNTKDAQLPEQIEASGAKISRDDLQKFVDSQRYLQAKEVVDGYVQGLKVHVSTDVQGRLDKLDQQAKLAMSDGAAERSAATADLIGTFKSTSTSPEEKLVAASALLFARRRGPDGQLSETVDAGGAQIKASDLVSYLSANTQVRQGSASDAKANPGDMRLFAGDMLLRLDTNRFSLEDMNQICLSIVNDKNAPADPAAREKWNQLKLQAMTDAHGYRLGDLYELMKSRVEPAIAAMPTDTVADRQAKGQALASLQGRDSEAIGKTLESLRSNDDPRLAQLASYMLYASDAVRPSDRIDALAQLHKDGSPFAWPQGADRDAQNRWVEAANKALVDKLGADLPAQAGNDFDRASNDKFRAAQALMAKYSDLKSNPEIQAQINNGLMSLLSGDNPATAAKALPILLSRLQSYDAMFKQMKPEQITGAISDLRNGLFGDGAILDTLRSNSIDMLKDSSNYSTYSTRTNNLASDLQKMQADFESKKGKLSETEKAEMQNKIAELSRAYNNTSTAPGELKKAIMQAIPSMVSLTNANAISPAKSSDLKSFVSAVQDLCQVQANHPETASPDLRTEAVKTLVQLGDQNGSSSSLLAKLLAADPSPQVRLAAIDALEKMAPDNLQQICLQQLAAEKHPEVAKRLREVEFVNRRPDPDSSEYKGKFEQAKLDLINQAARALTGSESYLKSNNDLKFLDGQTLRKQALADLSDEYFNGVGGFFRFAWDGEKGVDAAHAQLLDKYAGYMRNSMDSLGQKAATDDDALKALVYVAMSNGRPLLKDDRIWGADKATEKLKEICQNASPEKATSIAWAVENLMLHQPAMSAAGRQNVLDGLKALIAKPGQAGLSNSQVSTLVASALQRELRNTPAAGAPDYAAHEKLQLDMLNLLSDQRFRTKEILPVLQAITYDGAATYKIGRNPSGDVNKVTYPNGSSTEIQAQAGGPSRMISRDSAGRETVWSSEPGKPNLWFKDGDKDKKEPLAANVSFDRQSGDLVRVDGDHKTLTRPNGAQIESLNGQISKVVYPDGSSRQFDPPGANYSKYTLNSADGKNSEVWLRDGNTNNFYKQGDSEKKNLLPAGLIDNASGDFVTVQGSVRTVTRADGSQTQIKDGVVTELAAPVGIAFNSSIISVRQKAQELYSQMADRSDLIRQKAELTPGFDAAPVSNQIAAQLANSRASSEAVGKAIALSEKLPAIASDDDPRRVPLQLAAHDGNELVRLMAARELAKSSNADDRKSAYTVLAQLEKQGSRAGYVNEAHELIGQILADVKVSQTDKTLLQNQQTAAAALDAGIYRSRAERVSDSSNALDYQDIYERATRELKENATRMHDLAQYQGSNNWFAQNDAYKLLDADKLAEAQRQAAKDAFPSFVPWIFTSRATIDQRCKDAVKEVWNKQEGQLNALGDQAKLAGDEGKSAREALASIILSQGQPLRESDRAWAMQSAARMIRDCIKDGQPGSRDMLWAVQAALIEEPSLSPQTRWYLMSAVSNAQERGLMDKKESAILMAAAVESEYQGMPSRDRDPAGYKASIENQLYAISKIAVWGNAEAGPVIEAIASAHPDASVKQQAKDALLILNANKIRDRAPSANLRSDAGTTGGADVSAAAANSQGEYNRQLALNQLQDQILELERIRLRLPEGSNAEQIEKALEAERRINA